MTWHTMQEIWERGFKAVMDQAVSEALAKADKLYVSVDIDVLDPRTRPAPARRAGRHHQRRPAPDGPPTVLRARRRRGGRRRGGAKPTTTPNSPSTPHTGWCSRRWPGMAARRRDAAHAKPGPPRRWRSSAVRYSVVGLGGRDLGQEGVRMRVGQPPPCEPPHPVADLGAPRRPARPPSPWRSTSRCPTRHAPPRAGRPRPGSPAWRGRIRPGCPLPEMRCAAG